MESPKIQNASAKMPLVATIAKEVLSTIGKVLRPFEARSAAKGKIVNISAV